MTDENGWEAIVSDSHMRPLYGGTEEEVLKWLRNGSIKKLYPEPRLFRVSLTTCTMTERQFIAYMEEKSKPAEHKCHSEEDIRRFFREELIKVLMSMREDAQDNAHGLAAYGNGDFHRIAFDAFASLAETEKSKLQAKEELKTTVADVLQGGQLMYSNSVPIVVEWVSTAIHKNSLTVLVSGRHMSADEFIDEYGG